MNSLQFRLSSSSPFDLLLFPPILMSSSMLLNHPSGHTKDLFLLNFYSNYLHSMCVLSIIFMWTNHPDHFYSNSVLDSNVFYKTCS